MTSSLPQRLRKNATEAENALWREVRNRQLDGCKFRRQHPIGRYVVDLVCVEKRLIVEVDGGQHDQQSANDARRTRGLETQGYRVVRFWNNEVLGNLEGVLEVLRRELSG